MSDTVMDYLQTDHRRLDGIMGRCREMMSNGDTSGAARQFEMFRAGLTRHIKIEEGILFPAFEKATGIPRENGPTSVMRFEHEEILRLLGLMREVFEAEEPAAGEFDSLRIQLISTLSDHNVKEERVLYPGTDRAMAAGDLAALVRSMRDFPE